MKSGKMTHTVMFLVVGVVAAMAAEEEVMSSEVRVRKCCEYNSVLVEISHGHRECKLRSELTIDLANIKWEPNFYDLATGTHVIRPSSYQLDHGLPQCNVTLGEISMAIYHHETTDDDMNLLKNGSLVHRLVSETGHTTDRYIYGPDKYCVDDLIIAHNETQQQDEILEFGYICVDTNVDIVDIMDKYVYPIGLSVSMLCLVATFLLYSVLPQLRDLTGKFILGICLFTAIAFALILVEIFGWNDPNVDHFAAEFCLHTSVVGIFLSLNCMGHHVWKIILANSVFTRVTDGQKLCYYSVYLLSSLTVVVALALSVHYLIAGGELKEESEKIGWECLSAFYAPVSLILMVNVMFYWTAQRRISRQMSYNRNMQHFQVNFDLYIKFLLVVSVWWLFFTLSLLDFSSLGYISKVFNMIQGPLVFLIAMCRTRVAFLFKRYFCEDSCCFGCCKTGEFIEEECKELSIIDTMRKKLEEDDDDPSASVSLLPSLNPRSNVSNSEDNKEMSKSLFNVRNNHAPGDVPPPPDPEMPVGRVKRLLKSNSLTALANINWGWRRETSV